MEAIHSFVCKQEQYVVPVVSGLTFRVWVITGAHFKELC